VLNFLSMQMGPEAMVAVKVKMKPAGTDVALIENVNAVEAKFREKFPDVAFLFMEPDLHE